MRTALVIAATGIAALASAPLAAQSAPPANACYIQLQSLMADQNGIADLRTAIRELDTRLRPQVEEVGRLKRLVESLEHERQQVMQAGSVDENGETARPLPQLARLDEDMARAGAELETKQTQLKADYAAQMQAIVGPVQARIGQRAQQFGGERGCRGMKMARTPDLAGLQSSGARDVTMEFVTWYQ